MMRTLNVYLFIFDSLSDWEAGYAIAGINNPQFQKTPGRYCVRTAALTKDAVLTMGGIAWDEKKNAEAVESARAFLNAEVPVAAICGATAGLARGGLLNNRRHTSNAKEYLAATGYSGEALYDDAPAVTDGDLITASGIAPVDFALHIFRRLDVYAAPVLDAWYGLFKIGRPEYYEALIKN